MRTFSVTLIGLLLLSSVAGAQPGPSVAPVFKVVAKTDKNKGVITFRETEMKFVPQQRAVVEIVNGLKVVKNVTDSVPVFVESYSTMNAGESRFITADGKQVPIDEVWKRATANTVVVVSNDGNTPPQAYLRALSADTIIIIPPLARQAPVPAPKVVEPPAKKKT